jgi:hypothetical protein
MELRIRSSENLIYQYKIFCMKHKLSVPKQTMELIRKFLEIQEENDMENN